MAVSFEEEAAFLTQAVRPEMGKPLHTTSFTFSIPSSSFNGAFNQEPQSSSDATDFSDAPAGNTTPKLKPRRVSTSALPAVDGTSHPNLIFRDEMGITASSSLSLARQNITSMDLPEFFLKKQRPRKSASLSLDPKPAVDSDVLSNPAPKRARRNMWTEEETRTLVEGCKLHGVGNWKMILDDPQFSFQDRSPVDLKDRFRVSFPEAYRKHYPNAKTHLSNRTSSTLPDGVPLFEKSLPKKRRPFTAAEDEALRRGYDKYGTVWASIAKDPIFATRRSTDLRDRFRNAFPDLYIKAGYKPRPTSKKVPPVPTEVVSPVDEQPLVHSVTPSPRKPRRTSDGATLGRSKTLKSRHRPSRSSAPSVACSDDDDDDDKDPTLARHQSDPAVFTALQSTTPQASNSLKDFGVRGNVKTEPPQSPHLATATLDSSFSSDYTRMDISGDTSYASTVPLPEDRFMGMSTPNSPSGQLRAPSGRIGNSAWGPSSWFSPNPRLGSNHTQVSPFSGWRIPEHGVLDRYDLYSGANTLGSIAHDSASEAGDKHGHHSFLDPASATPGFTHHHYAGDLISGAGLYSNNDFEGLSTTSGTTSHLDVGQLSLYSMEDEHHNPFSMEDHQFSLVDEPFPFPAERPRTAEPGCSRMFGQSDSGALMKRPSTAMSFGSHAPQYDPSPMPFYPQRSGTPRLERGVSAPTTTPASPFMSTSSSLPSSISQPVLQRSHSSTSFTSYPAPPTPSFDRFSVDTSGFTSLIPQPQPLHHQSFAFSPPPTLPANGYSHSQQTFQVSPSHHNQHRSASQPPREHRPLTTRASSSFYDFLQLDEYGASPSTSNTYYPTEPLSTAALDLHYGIHGLSAGHRALTPSYARDNPNDPLAAHTAFMQSLDLGNYTSPPTSTMSPASIGEPIVSNNVLRMAAMDDVRSTFTPIANTNNAYSSDDLGLKEDRPWAVSSPRTMHARGQSFTVAPRDLTHFDLGSAAAKKRKRASWDGKAT